MELAMIDVFRKLIADFLSTIVFLIAWAVTHPPSEYMIRQSAQHFRNGPIGDETPRFSQVPRQHFRATLR
jgi:hypothetical protein